MTYDFSKLSEKQIAALSDVAFGGQGGGCGHSTLRSLERRGLIEQRTEEWSGGLKVFVYEMPLPAHMAFCAWCEENVPDAEVVR